MESTNHESALAQEDAVSPESSAVLASLLPLYIFAAEVCVVTLCTIRTIFVARGQKYLAPLLGFFEVSIWLFAIGAVMKNLSNTSCYIAFAGGFTLGNFLGVLIEKKLAMGSAMVRIITQKDADALIERLKEAGYGVTSITGQGGTGPVRIVLTVVKRKELGNVQAIIRGFDPAVFYSIDEVQKAARGVFPLGRSRSWSPLLEHLALSLLPAQNHRTGLEATGARAIP
jgi:uncharacterized protein YebE (UPF0316 family)